ncbi:hypothetical protein LCGC14_2546630 [marine sediment metagenome]|uniref:Uncharacterized protein n=1 Tax=marine sediment metagenome TaxID=412755 RepID=A0A0F9BBX6_9ZZZZ
MKCKICEAEKNLQIHHLSYIPEVTQILCQSCHQNQHEGHGVGLPIGWNPRFDENREAFSKLWDKGNSSYNDLMTNFSISYATVRRWANLLNKGTKNRVQNTQCLVSAARTTYIRKERYNRIILLGREPSKFVNDAVKEKLEKEAEG